MILVAVAVFLITTGIAAFLMFTNTVTSSLQPVADNPVGRPAHPYSPPNPVFPTIETPSVAGPDEVTVARQELDEVAAALEALTEEQRDAIALRFFAGLSAREAAVVMGKQEGTIRGLQFRAIAAIRRQLRIDEPDAQGGDDAATGGRIG